MWLCQTVPHNGWCQAVACFGQHPKGKDASSSTGRLIYPTGPGQPLFLFSIIGSCVVAVSIHTPSPFNTLSNKAYTADSPFTNRTIPRPIRENQRERTLCPPPEQQRQRQRRQQQQTLIPSPGAAAVPLVVGGGGSRGSGVSTLPTVATSVWSKWRGDARLATCSGVGCCRTISGRSTSEVSPAWCRARDTPSMGSCMS